MYASPDVLGLGRLADWLTKRKHGRKVFYVSNGHINYSNYSDKELSITVRITEASYI